MPFSCIQGTDLCDLRRVDGCRVRIERSIWSSSPLSLLESEIADCEAAVPFGNVRFVPSTVINFLLGGLRPLDEEDVIRLDRLPRTSQT